jgi:hypothetical protein
VTLLSLKQALPPELRAGDALAFSVQTALVPPSTIFISIAGVIANVATSMKIGGAGVAVDASGVAAFTVASSVTAAWMPGRYAWVAFSLDGSGNRNELALGQIVILPDVAAGPVDPRSYNERVLGNLRALIEGKSLDDVFMYKIGSRELTKLSHKELMTQEAIFEDRVRRERIRRGEKLPRKTIGIRFGG